MGAREGRPPGMAGDRRGASRKRAKGQDASTERKRDPNTCAVLSCVRAGRRVPQGRKHSGKKNTPTSTTGERTTQSEKAAGERDGASEADKGTRVKKNGDAGEQAGNGHGCRGAGPGGRAPNKSGKAHAAHTKGGGKSDRC